MSGTSCPVDSRGSTLWTPRVFEFLVVLRNIDTPLLRWTSVDGNNDHPPSNDRLYSVGDVITNVGIYITRHVRLNIYNMEN